MIEEKKVEQRTVNGACRVCGQIKMITLTGGTVIIKK